MKTQNLKLSTVVALLVILIAAAVEYCYYSDYKDACALLLIYIAVKSIIQIEKS